MSLRKSIISFYATSTNIDVSSEVVERLVSDFYGREVALFEHLKSVYNSANTEEGSAKTFLTQNHLEKTVPPLVSGELASPQSPDNPLVPAHVKEQVAAIKASIATSRLPHQSPVSPLVATTRAAPTMQPGGTPTVIKLPRTSTHLEKENQALRFRMKEMETAHVKELQALKLKCDKSLRQQFRALEAKLAAVPSVQHTEHIMQRNFVLKGQLVQLKQQHDEDTEVEREEHQTQIDSLCEQHALDLGLHALELEAKVKEERAQQEEQQRHLRGRIDSLEQSVASSNRVISDIRNEHARELHSRVERAEAR
jgi:hypothetical protein